MVEETTTMETEVRDDYDIIESSANVINDIEDDSQTTKVLSVIILISSVLGFIVTIIGSIFGGKKLIDKIKTFKKKKKAEDTEESDEGDLEEVDVNEEAEETGKKRK